MKIMRGFSALLLIIAILCPQNTVYAAEKKEHRELIVSLGLSEPLEGEDFFGERYVTNKEYKNAVRLMTGSKTENEAREYIPTDIDDRQAAETENVVYSMVRLLGYPKESWQRYSSESGITKKIGMSEKYITRDVFEAIVYNTLVAERVKITHFNGSRPVYEKQGTILEDVFNIVRIEDVAEADTTAYVNTSPVSGIARDEMLIGGMLVRGIENTKKYLARRTEVFVKRDSKNTNTGYAVSIEKTDNEEIKKTSEVIDGATTNKKLVWYDKEKEIRRQKSIPEDAVVIFNGKRMGGAWEQDRSVFTPGDGEVNLIDNDGDGDVDAVVVWSYNLYNVDYVNAETSVIVCRDFSYGTKIELEGKSYFICDENGDTLSLADIEPNNVLCVTDTTEENIYIACSKQEVVEGIYKRDGYSVYIGNDKYSIGNSGLYDFSGFSDGDLVRAYLDIYGRTAFIVGKSEYEYAFLNRVYCNNLEEEPMYLKIYSQDGRICTKEFSDHVNVIDGGIKSSYSKKKTGANGFSVLQQLTDGRRELIKYKENKLGKVTEIVFARSKIGQDIPNTTSGFDLYYADNAGGAFSFKEAKYLQNTFVSRYRITNNTLLFSVEENTSEPEKFRRLSVLDLQGDSDYKVMIYDVNDRFEVGAVVFEKCPDWYSKWGSIVADVSKEVGADDEILTRLKLYTAGEEKIVYVGENDIEPNRELAQKYANGGYKLSDIKIGDIIYYELGTDGLISDFAYLHKNTGDRSYYHRSNYGWGDIYIPNCPMAVVYCPIKSMYDDMFVIYCDGSMPIAESEERRYYIVENNKIRKAKYSEVVPGDDMVGMWKWSSLGDVVIYRR